MQDDISGWNDWNQAFSAIDELSSPSELHGILTGIICVTLAPTEKEWEEILRTLHIPALTAETLQLLTEEAEVMAAQGIFVKMKENGLKIYKMLLL